jgi:hypothetical protein
MNPDLAIVREALEMAEEDLFDPRGDSAGQEALAALDRVEAALVGTARKFTLAEEDARILEDRLAERQDWMDELLARAETERERDMAKKLVEANSAERWNSVETKRAQELEARLATVTQERDEALETAEYHQRLHGQAASDAREEHRYAEAAEARLATVTQERDAFAHLAEQRRVEGRRILNERNEFEQRATRLAEALNAFLYVSQECNCSMDGAPRGFVCARCRAVKILGGDSAALAVAPTGQPEPREGLVNVYRHDGRYLGCMGIDTWRWIAERDIGVRELEARFATGHGCKSWLRKGCRGTRCISVCSASPRRKREPALSHRNPQAEVRNDGNGDEVGHGILRRASHHLPVGMRAMREAVCVVSQGDREEEAT